MKIIFAEILRELKDSGYQVTARVMNTKYFNIPQARQRVIFVGVRNDITIKPTHPSPQNKPMKLKTALYDYPQGLSDGEFTGERLNIAKRIKPHSSGEQVIKGYSFGLKRLCWGHPSRTVTRMIGRPNASFGGGLIHPDENRHVNIAELKRIMSFPDEFKLVGNFQEQWGRLGNSVPPLFMRAIANHIKAEPELL
jgi:DNA (cytosine-5)-methyltransferase 1